MCSSVHWIQSVLITYMSCLIFVGIRVCNSGLRFFFFFLTSLYHFMARGIELVILQWFPHSFLGGLNLFAIFFLRKVLCIIFPKFFHISLCLPVALISKTNMSGCNIFWYSIIFFLQDIAATAVLFCGLVCWCGEVCNQPDFPPFSWLAFSIRMAENLFLCLWILTP